MEFKNLGLCAELLENVRKAGYVTPTPIQQATIPLVLEGKDVLGCAQTGTGKTAAFALPILQRLKQQPSARPDAKIIRALILSPTRELAQQTYENFQQYGAKYGLNCAVIFGGVGQDAQVHALHRGADIVVACPGRLMDLMGQGFVRLDFVEIFVLDEADRMLDMGFIHDVRRVVERLPQKRQTLLFSATMPPEVESLALDLLKDPENVKVNPVTSTVEAIDQCLYYVDKSNKRHLLAALLKSEDLENALVFSRTKHGVDRIVRDLKRDGIDAEGIHGDKSQFARQTALNRFKSGDVKVLVATDIAARGIDIAGLSHVINYDMPMEPESYIHRIGRTGRAGRTGKAISFCCIDEIKQLGQVEKLIKKRLREEKSDWPMEVLTPSEPKPRGMRPGKLEPVKEAAAPRPAKRGLSPQMAAHAAGVVHVSASGKASLLPSDAINIDAHTAEHTLHKAATRNTDERLRWNSEKTRTAADYRPSSLKASNEHRPVIKASRPIGMGTPLFGDEVHYDKHNALVTEMPHKEAADNAVTDSMPSSESTFSSLGSSASVTRHRATDFKTPDISFPSRKPAANKAFTHESKAASVEHAKPAKPSEAARKVSPKMAMGRDGKLHPVGTGKPVHRTKKK